MSRNEKDSAPPPYSELNSRAFSPSRGQNILDQLTLTRAHHIQSVIDTNIIPLIEAQASNGIAQTTIAMLPSDIPLPPIEEKSEFSFDSADNKPVEVVGFPSEEEPKVVRLEGQLNRTEFWRPQVVIDELERVLRSSLNTSPQLRSPTRLAQFSEFEASQSQSRRNFLSRLVPSKVSLGRSHGGSSEESSKQVEDVGLVLVKVKLEEVRLRTVNEFGLYDTMARQCIIIRVDARC